MIDHDSPTGFESIAEAREHILRMGRKETEDTSIPVGQVNGCHVVAPVRLFAFESFSGIQPAGLILVQTDSAHTMVLVPYITAVFHLP